MNTEKIKELCAEIEKAFNDGKTPQEIAETFNAYNHGENNDYEYDEYIVDFKIGDDDGFGITFWRDQLNPEWHWENSDEIWLWETEDWAHWKQL